jgi:hypothetical protein
MLPIIPSRQVFPVIVSFKLTHLHLKHSLATYAHRSVRRVHRIRRLLHSTHPSKSRTSRSQGAFSLHWTIGSWPDWMM